MAYLKINNPSKGGASAACRKQPTARPWRLKLMHWIDPMRSSPSFRDIILSTTSLTGITAKVGLNIGYPLVFHLITYANGPFLDDLPFKPILKVMI